MVKPAHNDENRWKEFALFRGGSPPPGAGHGDAAIRTTTSDFSPSDGGWPSTAAPSERSTAFLVFASLDRIRVPEVVRQRPDVDAVGEQPARVRVAQRVEPVLTRRVVVLPTFGSMTPATTYR